MQYSREMKKSILSEYRPVITYVASIIRISGWEEIYLDIPFEEGDVVLIKIPKTNITYKKIEDKEGREIRLKKGMHIVGVLGIRNSTKGLTGQLPCSEKKVTLLSVGGIIGTAIYTPSYIGNSFPIKLIGTLHNQDGKLNTIKMTDNLFCEVEKESLKPIILILGTSAECGKTTVAKKLISYFSSQGKKVGAVKITGTGRMRDKLAYKKAGAVISMDFVDVGLPETYGSKDETLRRIIRLLKYVSSQPVELIIAEAGGDILGGNVNFILRNQEIIGTIKKAIVVSDNIYGLHQAFILIKDLFGIDSTALIGALPLSNYLGNCLRYNSFNADYKIPILDISSNSNFSYLLDAKKIWMHSIDIYTKQVVTSELYKSKNALAKRVDTYYNHLHHKGNFIKLVNNEIEPILKLKDTLILDIGCGTGRPLLEVGPTVHEFSDKMINIDISYSMLEEAKKNCKIKGITSTFVQCDAENLPFISKKFKIVMARHMLYHVANVTEVVKEINRVLHDDGIFLATTNAKDSKYEIFDLHYNSLKSLKHPIFIPRGSLRFNEENGRIILQQFFKNVKVIEWRGYFDFLSVKDFMRYYTSTPYFKKASPEKEDLRRLYTIVADNVEAIIKAKGKFRVSHHGVIFICRNKI